MKIRIFKKLDNGVFHVRIQTEDWSERDRDLMKKYGEPEINLGGVIVIDESSSSDPCPHELDDAYARVMTESPFTHRFDSRDFGSVQCAKHAACEWAATVEERISASVTFLRSRGDEFTTEEVTEY